jgi:predicted type IV restriction endonuclease
MSFEEAREKVVRLLERFEENYDSRMNGRYNEAQVRQEFINPFFEALGWDIYNKSGHAEQYKDVVHEEYINRGHLL